MVDGFSLNNIPTRPLSQFIGLGDEVSGIVICLYLTDF